MSANRRNPNQNHPGESSTCIFSVFSVPWPIKGFLRHLSDTGFPFPPLFFFFFSINIFMVDLLWSSDCWNGSCWHKQFNYLSTNLLENFDHATIFLAADNIYIYIYMYIYIYFGFICSNSAAEGCYQQPWWKACGNIAWYRFKGACYSLSWHTFLEGFIFTASYIEISNLICCFLFKESCFDTFKRYGLHKITHTLLGKNIFHWRKRSGKYSNVALNLHFLLLRNSFTDLFISRNASPWWTWWRHWRKRESVPSALTLPGMGKLFAI